MSDDYECPVEWCDATGDLASLRGHVNGSTDSKHDWTELKDQIEAQATPSEGDETSEEGGEATRSEGGEMATDDEYENQTNDDQEEPAGGETNETNSEGGNKGASDGGSDPSAGAGAAAAGATALIAGQSMWVVVGIAALALLVVLMLTTDQGEPGDGEKTETNQEGGSEPSSEGDSDEEARGLVQ